MVCQTELGVNLTEVDLVSIGGGTSRNADSKNAELRDDPLDQAVASVKLHRVPQVLLTSHEDCGALGGSARFGSEAAELAWHKAFLEERKRKLETLLARGALGLAGKRRQRWRKAHLRRRRPKDLSREGYRQNGILALRRRLRVVGFSGERPRTKSPASIFLIYFLI